jgi:DNA sulfur modification protein DndD
MRIELIGWETENLRCPDMTIDLLIGSNPAHVSLIQMPNGTAKTTTLNLIRAALNGEADRWNSEKVKSFRRVGELNSTGKFHLKLRVDEKPLDFELNFDFEEGKVNYFTSSPSLGGEVHRWEPPLHLKRFFDKRFVQLFIFDGEFAKDLLDPDKTHASEAIDNLFQLYLLDEIKEKIDKNWNEATENKVASKKGKTQQKNKIYKLKERIDKVQQIRNKKKEDLESIEREIEKLEEKINEYNSQHEDLSEQLNESKQEKVKAEEKIESRIHEIMGQIRQPQSLHETFVDSLLELKNKLDKAKLPEKASRQFFIDLLDEEKCICGRELDDETRQAIQNRSELYLSDRTAAFLNGLKEDIRNNFSSETYEIVHLLTENIQHLKTDIEVRQYAETHCTAIQNQIFEEGDSQVKSWKTSLDDKKRTKDTLEEHLKNIERSLMSKDDIKNLPNIWCLKVLNKWLEEAEQKLAEISDTVALTQKKRILQKIIENSLKKARNNLQDLIIGECNIFWR